MMCIKEECNEDSSYIKQETLSLVERYLKQSVAGDEADPVAGVKEIKEELYSPHEKDDDISTNIHVEAYSDGDFDDTDAENNIHTQDDWTSDIDESKSDLDTADKEKFLDNCRSYYGDSDESVTDFQCENVRNSHKDNSLPKKTSGRRGKRRKGPRAVDVTYQSNDVRTSEFGKSTGTSEMENRSTEVDVFSCGDSDETDTENDFRKQRCKVSKMDNSSGRLLISDLDTDNELSGNAKTYSGDSEETVTEFQRENAGKSQKDDSLGETASEKQRKRRKYVKSVDDTYRCNLCRKNFSSKRALYIHDRNIHLESGSKQRCNICEKTFYMKQAFDDHMSFHMGEKKHRCDFCEKDFTYLPNLNSHIKAIHLKQKPHECELCGKAFAYKSILTKHMRSHTGEKPFTCPMCDKKFKHSNHMNRHIEQNHVEEKFRRHKHRSYKEYRCYICDKIFSRKDHMQVHIRAVHQMLKPHPCPICERCFATKSTRNDHVKTHDKKRRKKRTEVVK